MRTDNKVKVKKIIVSDVLLSPDERQHREQGNEEDNRCSNKEPEYTADDQTRKQNVIVQLVINKGSRMYSWCPDKEAECTAGDKIRKHNVLLMIKQGNRMYSW